jgi:hypothetical protein
LLYPYVWGICLTVFFSYLFGKVLCYGMVFSFLIKNLNFLALMSLSHIMLHIGLTFPAVITNAISGAPIRLPHGNNVYLLLQWLLKLQTASLCIGILMALLKLILWDIGPPLWLGHMEERFNHMYRNSELLLLISI